MPVPNRQDLGQIATVPDNLTQPPRFGAIHELVKDAFVLELRHFLSTANTRLRDGELPRIDKYAVAIDTKVDPLETAVSLIRSYPDITEDLPLIAILATTGRNLKLSISDKFTSMVVPPAKVVGSVSGPFVLTDGMDLEITTQPDGVATNVVTSRFVFPAFMFTNIAAATPEEIVYAINFQALYATAYVVTSGASKYIGIRAGGPQGTTFPNKITITGGTALAALGLIVNQTNQNYGADKQAYERHHMAAELTVAIEIVAESENVRTDISDLLYDFFSYVMADRKFQFYGRSVFDESILDETYQIILKDNQISFSGEQEVERVGDPRDKLYINRISIPVVAIQYSDRIITDAQGTTVTPLINIGLISNFDLPEPN
jgi:hypothetical protein